MQARVRDEWLALRAQWYLQRKDAAPELPAVPTQKEEIQYAPFPNSQGHFCFNSTTRVKCDQARMVLRARKSRGGHAYDSRHLSLELKCCRLDRQALRTSRAGQASHNHRRPGGLDFGLTERQGGRVHVHHHRGRQAGDFAGVNSPVLRVWQRPRDPVFDSTASV